MRRIGSISLLCLGMAIAGQALAGAIIAPTSGVINAGGPGFGSLAETINQNGLLTGYTPGVTDFDTYLAGNPRHSFVFAGNEWFGNSGGDSSTVTYDFGGLVTVDRLALWNEDATGIGLLSLFASVDGVTFAPLALNLSPTDNPINVDYPADVFAFAATSLQFVRFEMSRCPQPNGGAPFACAIGEVAFREATATVPEPVTGGLIGLGLAGLAAMRRRKA